MNETINNEIEMENIETTGIEMDNLIPLDYEVCDCESDDEGNLIGIILGVGALAGAAIGGIALAKKAKKDGDKKEGFIKKMAIKYLTKKGYTVEQVEANDVTTDEDDCDGLIPDKK